METNIKMQMERVKIARKAIGFTQNEIAELLGMDRGRYKNYEVQNNMPDDLAKKFCEITGVRILWLKYGEGPQYQSDEEISSEEKELIWACRDSGISIKNMIESILTKNPSTKITDCNTIHRLKEIRMALGLTQEQIAQRTSLPNDYISKLEDGTLDINASHIKALCNSFPGIQPWMLFVDPHDIISARDQEIMSKIHGDEIPQYKKQSILHDLGIDPEKWDDILGK